MFDPSEVHDLGKGSVIVSPVWSMIHTGEGERPWRLTGSRATFSGAQAEGFIRREIADGVTPVHAIRNGDEFGFSPETTELLEDEAIALFEADVARRAHGLTERYARLARRDVRDAWMSRYPFLARIAGLQDPARAGID